MRLLKMRFKLHRDNNNDANEKTEVENEANAFLTDWKREAIELQDTYSALFRDRIWDEFKADEKNYLYPKIASALFGSPEAETEDLGFSKDQKRLAERIIDKINKHSFYKDKINIAVIFICVLKTPKIKTTVPLFRVRKNGQTDKSELADNIFVDNVGRVYDNWDEYLEHNTWDESWLCAPANGYYSGEFDYIFINQEKKGSLNNKLDKLTTVTNVGTSLTMLTGALLTLFPPTSPAGVVIMAASTGVGAPGAIYGVGRSAHKLYDMNKHEQSIGLKDGEARQCWLVTSASILALGTLGSGKLLSISTRAGCIASSTTNILCSGLQYSSIGVSGLGIINSLYELKKKKNISSLDILQITTSILLFTHSLFSLKKSDLAIKDGNNIAEIKNGKDKKDNSQEKSESTFKRGQKFIKNFVNIDSIPTILEVAKEISSSRPLSTSEKTSVLSLLKKLHDGQITQNQFIKKIPSVIRELIKMTENIDEIVEKVRNIWSNDITIGGKTVKQLKPFQITNIGRIINAFNKELLSLIMKIIGTIKFETICHFHQVLQKCIGRLEEEIFERRIKNPNPCRPTGTTVIDYYKTQIQNELVNTQNGVKDEKPFKEILENSQPSDEFIPELNNLPIERYCDIVVEMVGNEITIESWSQYDDSLKCKFNSNDQGTGNITFINIDFSSVLALHEETGEARLYC